MLPFYDYVRNRLKFKFSVGHGDGVGAPELLTRVVQF